MKIEQALEIGRVMVNTAKNMNTMNIKPMDEATHREWADLLYYLDYLESLIQPEHRQYMPMVVVCKARRQRKTK